MNTVSKYLAKVDRDFSVESADNGFVLQIAGEDHKGEWKRIKLVVTDQGELFTVIDDLNKLPRND